MGDEPDRRLGPPDVAERPESCRRHARDQQLVVGRASSSASGLEGVGRGRHPQHAVVDPHEHSSMHMTFDRSERRSVGDELIDGDDAVTVGDRDRERRGEQGHVNLQMLVDRWAVMAETAAAVAETVPIGAVFSTLWSGA